jgi:hypothetical protein
MEINKVEEKKKQFQSANWEQQKEVILKYLQK